MNNITFLIAKCMDSSVQKVKAKTLYLIKNIRLIRANI